MEDVQDFYGLQTVRINWAKSGRKLPTLIDLKLSSFTMFFNGLFNSSIINIILNFIYFLLFKPKIELWFGSFDK